MSLMVYDEDKNVLMTKATDGWLLFEPKKDISAYEVSLLLAYFMPHLISGRTSEGIPENILRHFKKEK